MHIGMGGQAGKKLAEAVKDVNYELFESIATKQNKFL